MHGTFFHSVGELNKKSNVIILAHYNQHSDVKWQKKYES